MWSKEQEYKVETMIAHKEDEGEWARNRGQTGASS